MKSASFGFANSMVSQVIQYLIYYAAVRISIALARFGVVRITPFFCSVSRCFLTVPRARSSSAAISRIVGGYPWMCEKLRMQITTSVCLAVSVGDGMAADLIRRHVSNPVTSRLGWGLPWRMVAPPLPLLAFQR